MALFGRKKAEAVEAPEVSEIKEVNPTSLKLRGAKKVKAEVSKEDSAVNAYLEKIPTPPAVDDLVEGPVISIDKGAVYIDLPPFGTGIIYGKEFQNARDIIKRINVGDTVAGKVVGIGGKEGYIEISLKEARQAIIWSEAEDAIREKRTFELPITDANKGGLIINWQGIT
ncbi:MAG: S1 RNA-binding domain-containing protein, partial [Patescibacteria group bacterium]